MRCVVVVTIYIWMIIGYLILRIIVPIVSVGLLVIRIQQCRMLVAAMVLKNVQRRNGYQTVKRMRAVRGDGPT